MNTRKHPLLRSEGQPHSGASQEASFWELSPLDESLKVPSATTLSPVLCGRALQNLQRQPMMVGWHLWQAGSVAQAGNLKLRDNLKRNKKSIVCLG